MKLGEQVETSEVSGGKPEFEHRRLMLGKLHRRLKDAELNDEDYLELNREDFAEMVADSGLNQTQATKLFTGLVREGYVRLADSSVEYAGVIEIAWVSDLTDRGKIAIGELPDAQERLIAAFEAAIPRIKADEGLDDSEKDRRVEWARHTIDLIKGLAVRGAGDAIFNHLPI